jgi:hypothetical protein
MAKKKSAFIGLTEDEASQAEANSFTVLLGNDFYLKNGKFIFSYNEATKHYDTLLKNILATIDRGTEKQKNSAIKCLGTLQIQQLRIQ